MALKRIGQRKQSKNQQENPTSTLLHEEEEKVPNEHPPQGLGFYQTNYFS
jgi:hypothetical protein